MRRRSWIVGSIAGVFMLAGLTTSASALDVNLGVLGVPSTTIEANNPPNVGFFPFIDNYNFQVATLANLTSQTTIINFSTFDIPLDSVTVSLLENGVTVAVATAIANVFDLAYANLAPAVDYTLRVQGLALGDSGGLYSLVVDVSPVPLPPAVWLFVSALLGLISVSRLRGDRSTA